MLLWLISFKCLEHHGESKSEDNTDSPQRKSHYSHCMMCLMVSIVIIINGTCSHITEFLIDNWGTSHHQHHY